MAAHKAHTHISIQLTSCRCVETTRRRRRRHTGEMRCHIKFPPSTQFCARHSILCRVSIVNVYAQKEAIRFTSANFLPSGRPAAATPFTRKLLDRLYTPTPLPFSPSLRHYHAERNLCGFFLVGIHNVYSLVYSRRVRAPSRTTCALARNAIKVFHQWWCRGGGIVDCKASEQTKLHTLKTNSISPVWWRCLFVCR